MEQFRDDNTEGYTASDLVELNKRFQIACAKYGKDVLREKSVQDYIAERVQCVYDTEMSARSKAPHMLINSISEQ